MELGMASNALFLVMCLSLFLSGSCGTLFTNQQEVKIIKTKAGDFECVDFYKQPTFNHPLLKNRISQEIPNLVELQSRKIKGIGLKDGGCPLGTVPILRTNSKSSYVNNLPPPEIQHCVAIVHTNKLDRKFFGVSGSLEVFKPLVYNNNQWSCARLKLSNVNDSLEAGWMVNAQVFSDYEAHLYTRFAIGALGGKGCINLECEGFIQVATDMPLGMGADEYSVIGGEQVFWNLSIDRHQDDGNWWLSYSREIQDKKAIRYWPHQIFFTLAGFGNNVEWGGEIFNLGPSHFPPPDMGNGVTPNVDALHSASIGHATYVDENFTSVLEPLDIHEIVDCDAYYGVEDEGYTSGDYGHLIHYGGKV